MTIQGKTGALTCFRRVKVLLFLKHTIFIGKLNIKKHVVYGRQKVYNRG